MRKKKCTVKNIQRAYNLNAQSGIVVLSFLIFFSFTTGLIAVDTFRNNDFGIMIVMLILCIFCILIVMKTFNTAVQTFRTRRMTFNEHVPKEMVSVLDEELQNKSSFYFENFCIGQRYLINLNPEPFDSICLEKRATCFFIVKKVKLGTKYTYWANQFSIYGKNSRKLTINIVNKYTAESLIFSLRDECNMRFEE